MAKRTIKLAIVGLGNCVHHYSKVFTITAMSRMTGSFLD